MGRVLPFIFVSVALVATAVVQAQSDRQELTSAPLTVTPLTAIGEVDVEFLDTPETP